MISVVRDEIAPRVTGVGLAIIAIAIVWSTINHRHHVTAEPHSHQPQVNASPKPHGSHGATNPTKQRVHASPSHGSGPSGFVPVNFSQPVPVVRRPSSPSHQSTARPTTPPTRLITCTISARVPLASACLRL